MWDKIIGDVKEQLPPFNRKLLIDYRRDQISQLAEYMDVVYREAVKLVESGNLVYRGFYRMTPEERVRYLIDSTSKVGSSRFKLEILDSEMELVKYVFEYKGQEYGVFLHLPYLVNDQILISGTSYHFQLPIIERIIYRIPDGLIVKVMRSPLQFWRSEQYSYTSEEGRLYYDPIITVRAHFGAKKREKHGIKTSLVLYLLAERGMTRTLETFGIDPSLISFSAEVPEKKDPEREHFIIRNKSGQTMCMAVHRSIFDNLNHRRVVASIHYLLQFFTKHDLSLLYDPEGTIFMIMLGRSIHGMPLKEALAHGNIVNHQKSLTTYLDPFTKVQLINMGINVEDVYDLFVYVFNNMDDLVLNHSPSDLFEKKIAVNELILSKTIRLTFREFYDLCKKEQRAPGDQAIRRSLKRLSRPIVAIHECGARSNPPIYNDNWLAAIGGKKVRQAANQQAGGQRGRKKGNLLTSREHYYHPSMMVVESALSIPASSPGVGGDINPYVPITDDGCFIMPEWAKDIYGLLPFLLNR